MIIRRANENEIKQLLQWSIPLTEELSAGYMKSNVQMTNDMVSKVLSNGGYYLVAQHGWDIMGWVLVGFDLNFYKNTPIGFLYELYVFPSYRKNGVGKVLMKEAVDQLKTAGMKFVQLNVFAGNSAKEMYEKLGFKDVTTLMEKEL
ncbi:MAG TPA: GNAT family N-acetyltransferase [Bacillales bacterium]|nr:GNAT family N-acetyltransferase [Bacillales bacterium]